MAENNNTFIDDTIFKDIIEHSPHLPLDQHDAYRWFTIEELLENDNIHKYIKDIFIQKQG